MRRRFVAACDAFLLVTLRTLGSTAKNCSRVGIAPELAEAPLNRHARRSSVCFTTLSLIAAAVIMAPAHAQNYPLPSSPTTKSVCTNCPSPSTDLPLFPYSAPIRAFTGRFLDSQLTRDYRGEPVRTLRARGVAIVPERNRVYMQLGSTFAAYKLSTFFERLSSEKMLSVEGRRETTTTVVGEQYLGFDASVNAELDGWKTVGTEGQDRLYGFDWDDRGYVYLGYSTFGWGIVSDHGESGKLPLVFQQFEQKGDVPPCAMMVVRSAGRYYVLIGNGIAKSIVYDVTKPKTPKFITALLRGPNGTKFNLMSSWARTTGKGDSILAFVDYQGKLKLSSAAGFIAGKEPELTFSAEAGTYTAVTSDGVNFFAFSGNPYVNGSLSVFSPASAGKAASYVETKYPLDYPFKANGIRYSSHYLVVHGLNKVGEVAAKVFKLTGTKPEEVQTGDYVVKAYTTPPAGYARPSGFSSFVRDSLIYDTGSKAYWFIAVGGLGDVYEFAP